MFASCSVQKAGGGSLCVTLSCLTGMNVICTVWLVWDECVPFVECLLSKHSVVKTSLHRCQRIDSGFALLAIILRPYCLLFHCAIFHLCAYLALIVMSLAGLCSHLHLSGEIVNVLLCLNQGHRVEESVDTCCSCSQCRLLYVYSWAPSPGVQPPLLPSHGTKLLHLSVIQLQL